MQKRTRVTGSVIPLDKSDIDTDLIIPAQYLTSIDKQGYGKYLFARLRESDTDFVFNQPKFRGASIIVTQENFGCGSSREHAVWALQEAGIQAIIAVSFADIFFSNSAKNGLVLITQPKAVISHLLARTQESSSYQLIVDIEKQMITANENETFAFVLNSFLQYCLINGLDDLDYLLGHQAQINAHQVNKKRFNYQDKEWKK